ncbi:MAG TPA: hypothetical protein P5024_12225 [Burkholderiaceae bacterium]|nr:hypothetical protein [Burkholderiaceae bacterium]
MSLSAEWRAGQAVSMATPEHALAGTGGRVVAWDDASGLVRVAWDELGGGESEHEPAELVREL